MFSWAGSINTVGSRSLDGRASQAARLLPLYRVMYTGGSLTLIAIGAILYWAVTYHIAGVNLHMVGLILMAIGVIGLLFSLVSVSGGWRRRRLL